MGSKKPGNDGPALLFSIRAPNKEAGKTIPGLMGGHQIYGFWQPGSGGVSGQAGHRMCYCTTSYHHMSQDLKVNIENMANIGFQNSKNYSF